MYSSSTASSKSGRCKSAAHFTPPTIRGCVREAYDREAYGREAYDPEVCDPDPRYDRAALMPACELSLLAVRRWPICQPPNLVIHVKKDAMQPYIRSHAKRTAGRGHVLKWTCQNRVRCWAHSPTRTSWVMYTTHGLGLWPPWPQNRPIRMVAVTDCAPTIDPRNRLSAASEFDPFPDVSLKRRTARRQEPCSKYLPR